VSSPLYYVIEHNGIYKIQPIMGPVSVTSENQVWCVWITKLESVVYTKIIYTVSEV